MGQFAQVNGIRLHYLDHRGDGPNLVLMPGLTANANSFDGLIANGLDQTHRVLALDLRGRGKSDKPASGYSLSEHAKDVIGLLDSLGIDQVIMGGHSFGGLMSFFMASVYPDRVSRLVVMDAAGAMHPDTRAMIQPSIDRLGKVIPSWEDYLAFVKMMPFFRDWWDPAIESYFRADIKTLDGGMVIPQSRPEAIIEAVDNVLAEPWFEHLSKISQPTLLLNALGSFGLPGAPPLLPREQAMETVNALANCRYAEVPGNHITMLYGAGAGKIVEEIVRFSL
jgi:pimeloyl-ACP methyl ester carboxylesterase